MSIRECMSLASGSINYPILRLLHDSPRHAQQIAQHLDISEASVRVHLKKLRDEEFLSYETVGKYHFYHVATPFETPTHEWIMALIAMDDPVKSKHSSDEPVLHDQDPHPLLVKAQREYWMELAKGIYSILMSQGSFGEQKQVREKLNDIETRVERLKEK